MKLQSRKFVGNLICQQTFMTQGSGDWNEASHHRLLIDDGLLRDGYLVVHMTDHG